jgi:hypothetical protein
VHGKRTTIVEFKVTVSDAAQPFASAQITPKAEEMYTVEPGRRGNECFAKPAEYTFGSMITQQPCKRRRTRPERANRGSNPAALRVPRHDGHDSGVMADSIPE